MALLDITTLQDMLQLIPFAAGILSLYSMMKLNLDIGIKTWIKIKLLAWDLEAAYLKGDQSDIKHLQALLQIKKLYSTNAATQGTAISQLYQLSYEENSAMDARSILNTLIDRMGSRPKLDDGNKILIQSKIHILCEGLKDNQFHASSVKTTILP